jgi:hypothetical protein
MVSKRLKTASTRWNWYKARKTEPSWQHHGRGDRMTVYV